MSSPTGPEPQMILRSMIPTESWEAAKEAGYVLHNTRDVEGEGAWTCNQGWATEYRIPKYLGGGTELNLVPCSSYDSYPSGRKHCMMVATTYIQKMTTLGGFRVMFCTGACPKHYEEQRHAG